MAVHREKRAGEGLDSEDGKSRGQYGREASGKLLDAVEDWKG